MILIVCIALHLACQCGNYMYLQMVSGCCWACVRVRGLLIFALIWYTLVVNWLKPNFVEVLWSDSNCFHCYTRRSFMFTSASVYISLKHCLVSNIFSLPITVIKLSHLKTPTVRPSWINVSVLSF